ncbi:conserved hypothetical protein, partial [Trichinella spiralis]|uniref:hypothetical protein n=1 Tax=Trichinella spiralis TaxID=6334 RepID=UPI0001EFD2A8
AHLFLNYRFPNSLGQAFSSGQYNRNGKSFDPRRTSPLLAQKNDRKGGPPYFWLFVFAILKTIPPGWVSGPFINLNWDNEREPTTDANMANYDTTSRLLCPSRWYKLYRKILPLLLRNFFTFSLMVMMAWAVIYHSWLSFVWLVMACGIWIYHDSRKAYMLLSPLIIAYSQVLLVFQFIYGLNLTNDELPDEVAAVSLKQIGLSKDSDHPAEPLTVKLLLTFFCYITIRLLMKEKKMKNFGVDSSSVQGDGNDNVTTKKNMRIHITRLLPKCRSNIWKKMLFFILGTVDRVQCICADDCLHISNFTTFPEIWVPLGTIWPNEN